ncbi:MAG: sulfatase-like hydrolase/transferase [Verrucomicrobia bacterium]|nr:sulfatase-like hydrolase/transferase [Verrucomicrobiota bacterium]
MISFKQLPVLVLLRGALWILAASASSFAAAPQRPPNILLVTCDNLGYLDLGVQGHPEIRTPNIDRLAAQGVRLTALYAEATCTVSRAALLTGRYPQRNQLNIQLLAEPSKRPDADLARWGNMGIGLRHSEKLLPEFLKKAGYATGAFGKWNLGFAPGSRPTERGFDEYLGIASGNANYYHQTYGRRHDLFQGTEPIKRDGYYSSDLFADSAIAFIKNHADKPFFVYLPFNAAHSNGPNNMRPGEETVVWQAPQKHLDMYGYDPRTNDQRKRYYAVISALDEAFGRVLAAIDNLGLRDNTLVIFYNDNGVNQSELDPASNGNLRSGRPFVWEGGIRVPGFVRWPGVVPAGAVCHVPITHRDFFVLALNAAGAPLPADRVIDGRDPLPALTARTDRLHDFLCWDYNGHRAIRQGQYKLVNRAPRSDVWELYDLVNDSGETRDLAAAKPRLAAELEGRFRLWQESATEEVGPEALSVQR